MQQDKREITQERCDKTKNKVTRQKKQQKIGNKMKKRHNKTKTL